MTQETKTKIKPLGNRVIVEREAEKETVKGGIILPDSAKQKPETAKVVAVGKGKVNSEGNLIPVPVKEGDLILMDKYAGQEVTIDDNEYMILRAEDIIAIIEE